MPVTIFHCYQRLLDNARISITQCCLSCRIASCPKGTQGTSPQLLSLSVVVRLSFDVARFCLSTLWSLVLEPVVCCHTHWLVFCGRSRARTGCSFSCGFDHFLWSFMLFMVACTQTRCPLTHLSFVVGVRCRSFGCWVSLCAARCP